MDKAEHAYASEIEGHRRSLEGFFGGDDGPLSLEERQQFPGLVFYPVDPRFRVDVSHVVPVEPSERDLEMPTSDGSWRWAERVARLEFGLLGTRQSLYGYAFQDSDEGTLFVPFLDATSGRETYGAGRYLDVEAGPDGTVVLDFNLAYQPYCAFSPRYSCPITPPENRLTVAVTAGERQAGP